MTAGKRTAFSLVELVIVVVFIGILAAISVPRLKFSAISKYKAEATAKKIVTDLRHTRGLAIVNAATNTDGFELNMLGSEPHDSYEIKNRDTDEVLEVHQIDSAVSVTCPEGVHFRFLPLGNLTHDDTEVVVSAEGKTFTITIIPATGMIKCVEN